MFGHVVRGRGFLCRAGCRGGYSCVEQVKGAGILVKGRLKGRPYPVGQVVWTEMAGDPCCIGSSDSEDINHLHRVKVQTPHYLHIMKVLEGLSIVII